MFSVITNTYNKKTKGAILMELFTAAGKVKRFFLFATRDVRCVHHGWHGTPSIRYSSSCRTHVNMGAFCLHRHPVSLNYLYHARMVLSVGRVLCVLRTKCTLHSNHRLSVRYSNTQSDFSPGAAIFSLHTLASPSGRNVNYDEKQLTGEKMFELSLLSAQVS